MYADSERFYCFGGGEGGDVLDFIQRTENLSLSEAIARRPKSAALPPRDPALLTAAARFYAGQIRRCPEARGYLASRGVGPVAAARLSLGYSPGGGLRQALESRGFSADRIRDSGLFMERGSERFAGMVVVPNASGGLVRWLAGRAVDPNWTPRFQALHGPKPVLGLGRLGPAPPWAVVAEGLFDWLALTGWGLPAVAALGTQGMERVASALRGCPRVFLAFDGRRRGPGGDGAASDPARAAGPPLSPFPPASATWASLRPSPRAAPPSSACLRRPHAPPASGSPAASQRASPTTPPARLPAGLRHPNTPSIHRPGGPMPHSRRASPAHGFP